MGIPKDISAIFDSPTMPSLGPEARESVLSINQCKKMTTEALENANIGRIEGNLILSAHFYGMITCLNRTRYLNPYTLRTEATSTE